jgi:hypothetical protein
MNPITNEPGTFRQHDAKVHALAVRALRFRRRAKKMLLVTPLFVISALFLANKLSIREPNPPPAQIVASRPMTEPKNEMDSRILTDEELLAMFPAGSCFLAEVNGRKVLVFNDPAVKERFLN